MDYSDLITLGISFGLGLLVGLQREKSQHETAGVRTFTLIALLGTMTGFISRGFENEFIIPAVVIAVAAFMINASRIIAEREINPTAGQTTEVAVLLMFVIGAYLVVGHQILAVIVGGALAIILYIKETLHSFIYRLKEKDFSAIMKFVGISLVILPILPNQTYGPFQVINPREIWLMVTLIVGISILGYFVYKWVGQKAGMISNGILGGIISSTATVISYSQNSAKNLTFSKISAFVIYVSITVSIIRVIVEIAIVVPEKLSELISPFLVLFLFMTVVSGILFYVLTKNKEAQTAMPEQKNPAQFKSALLFGFLYALILLAVAFVENKFGDSGLYVVSIVGGLAKKDAITLSLAQTIKEGMDTYLGWKLIMTGTLANFAFKIFLVMLMGNRILLKWVASTFAISILAGLVLIWFWPPEWIFNF